MVSYNHAVVFIHMYVCVFSSKLSLLDHSIMILPLPVGSVSDCHSVVAETLTFGECQAEEMDRHGA